MKYDYRNRREVGLVVDNIAVTKTSTPPSLMQIRVTEPWVEVCLIVNERGTVLLLPTACHGLAANCRVLQKYVPYL
jgi:hypothetical protein